MNRLSCVCCGDSIHPDTAAAHNGLCMPCVRGNTRSIQERQAERQRQREAERAYEASPERQYWLALVRQVYDPDRGFDTLGLGDRQYWLINVLSGEVHNGGFDQFFSNSSGDCFQETVDALIEVGDSASLNLMMQAKALLFGDADVPTDRQARYAAMATADDESEQAQEVSRQLEALDRRFWAQADRIGEVLEAVAREHGLYDLS